MMVGWGRGVVALAAVFQRFPACGVLCERRRPKLLQLRHHYPRRGPRGGGVVPFGAPPPTLKPLHGGADTARSFTVVCAWRFHPLCVAPPQDTCQYNTWHLSPISSLRGPPGRPVRARGGAVDLDRHRRTQGGAVPVGCTRGPRSVCVRAPVQRMSGGRGTADEHRTRMFLGFHSVGDSHVG